MWLDVFFWRVRNMGHKRFAMLRSSRIGVRTETGYERENLSFYTVFITKSTG